MKKNNNKYIKNRFVLFFYFGVFLVFFFSFLYFYPKDNDSYTPHPYELVREKNNSSEQEVLGVQPDKTVKIPVLMYHNIAPVPKRGSSSYRGLFVSPEMFKLQMKYLKDKGYRTLTPTEFAEILKSGRNPKEKLVLITFDDGSRGQYLYAYPILKKYKMTATFYIISDRSPIKKKELLEMSKNGMVIESHTSTHRDLKKLKGDKNFRYELKSSKDALEGITKKKIVSIAYPGCVADNRTFNVLSNFGYEIGFSCGRSIYHRYKNRYYLSRVHVYSDMNSFKKALVRGL